ncbi:PorP/SprF family type IX secretion system membrane protein [Parapedobacter sp. 10938]|uniref:PorP/SprF family type IX secretion system membrane protein n=1 Tax=Parapedobacter flavus TaxID=3110225 RepID=UPI002DB95DFB|nr:type IX secretion system membrane protein PorP/SprF [Parapedobacter sp. 10938]MEC3880578.1 type IX secretion system membrane protein PorP/SprF [Parapedobacter sp. 10938]
MINYGKVLLLFLAGLPTAAVGQQQPHYTMYMANNFVLNPAVAGLEDYTDLKLSARSQWTGIADAPKTLYATLNMPLRRSDGRKRNVGIGGKVLVDQTGPILLSTAELNGAYHLPLNEAYRLSFGLGLGVNYRRIDFSKVQLEDPNDPIYGTDDFRQATPAASAGLWLYTNDMYVGVSAQNLLGDGLASSSVDVLTMPMERHYFATAGYRFRFGDFYLTPSLMLKFAEPAPIAYDVNLKGQVSDAFWAGLSWRHRDGVAAMAGFFVSSTLNVAYAYDFINSDLRRHSLGSHEIILGINLNNQKGPKCPTIAW